MTTCWSKLGHLVPEFQWHGIAAEEYLRTPKTESPELQSVADIVVSDSFAVFRSFDERGHDQNIGRWLPVLLDSTNNCFVRIDQRLVALADVPRKLGTFQRFERVPIKRLYDTSRDCLVEVA